jgi:phenylpropionate dioxygenase-like ring-hydroxylating dioxygenase large terminal subunit
MSRDTLVQLTKRTLDHASDGTLPLAPDVMRVPVHNYFATERWQLEMDRIFKRTPLVMGFSCELRVPHSFKALEVAGTPVLITRGADGAVRAFVNMCSHRGAVIVEPGTAGTARRHTCPYHAWNYDSQGALVGILDRQLFGDIDASCHGLTPLPCAERAGIIFVGLTPNGRFDIDTSLCGYDEVLAHLRLDQCHFVGSQRVEGPNWKVAYDGYLDFYHLPILHKNSFGEDYCNRAIYDAWGPHQRVSATDTRVLALADRHEDTWTDEQLTLGVWTIFPHTSIAGFKVEPPADAPHAQGGRMLMVSTLFPGDTPDTSVTVQNFLAAFEPDDHILPAIEATQQFLLSVVRDEDYFTGNRIQRAVKTGAKTEFLFGRNELGGQRFHGWVDRLVAADTDEQFAAEFARAEVVFAR